MSRNYSWVIDNESQLLIGIDNESQLLIGIDNEL